MAISNRKPIIDTDSFRDILNLISYDTGVFLDLDDTVLTTKTALGSNQWFIAIMDQAFKIYETEEEAEAVVLAICKAVHPHVQAKPVEPVIVKLIRSLQDIGVPVLALTARDFLFLDMTLHELNDIQVDFARGRHDKDKLILGNPNDRTVYQNGIIFCNGHDKGKCLKLFLEKCSRQPAHFVMADDKLKHPINVKKAIESLGKRFDGMRYGHLDHQNINLNMQEANQHLAKLLNKMPFDVIEKIKRLKLLQSDFSLLETKEELPAENLSIQKSLNSDNAKDKNKKSMTRSSSAFSFLNPKEHKSLVKNDFESDSKRRLDAPKEKHPIPMTHSRSALSIFAPKQLKRVPMLIPDFQQIDKKDGDYECTPQ